MERIYAFLPSVLAIAFIASVTFLYLKLVIKHFGSSFKSVEWHEKNQWKVTWTFGVPKVNVLAPAVEELIFRAPLVIAFSSMSSTAWYGVFISGGLFALTHWFGKQVNILEVFYARKNGHHKSDDMMEEVNRLHKEKGKMIMVRKALHVVFTLPLGILAGYYGIKYQSVWIAFGIHLVWNLVMPIFLSILMILGMLIFAGTSPLLHGLRRKWRRFGGAH